MAQVLKNQRQPSQQPKVPTSPSSNPYEDIPICRTPTPIPYPGLPSTKTPRNDEIPPSKAPSCLTHPSIRTPSNPPPRYPPSDQATSTTSTSRRVFQPGFSAYYLYTLLAAFIMLILILGTVAVLRRPVVGYGGDEGNRIFVDKLGETGLVDSTGCNRLGWVTWV